MRTPAVHPDLLIIIDQLYVPFQFTVTSPLAERESQEYGACDFTLNGFSVKFRAAKITPTKTGQFVTLWKREGLGPIQPFTQMDPIDLFIVSVRSEDAFGHFVFPKHVLAEHGVLTTKKKEGKRAIRVYPPWDIAENAQAKKSQRWQLEYFLETAMMGQPIDKEKLKKLYQAVL